MKNRIVSYQLDQNNLTVKIYFTRKLFQLFIAWYDLSMTQVIMKVKSRSRNKKKQG